MNTFYNKVVNNNIELSKAFDEYSSDFTSKEWRELQDLFHQKIENDYPTIRCEITPEIVEERNPIPERIKRRIKVAAMLLTILALGGNYSRKLYLNTLDFCTTTQVKNGSFVS
ncbi:MAG: hypothetical protein RJQ00_06535 [Vicingaceae bacterium]